MANVPAEQFLQIEMYTKDWGGRMSLVDQLSIPGLADRPLGRFLKQWPLPAVHCSLASLSDGMREE